MSEKKGEDRASPFFESLPGCHVMLCLSRLRSPRDDILWPGRFPPAEPLRLEPCSASVPRLLGTLRSLGIHRFSQFMGCPSELLLGRLMVSGSLSPWPFRLGKGIFDALFLAGIDLVAEFFNDFSVV